MITVQGSLVQFNSDKGNGFGFISFLCVGEQIVEQRADIAGSGNSQYIHYRFVQDNNEYYTDKTQLPDCNTSFGYDCPGKASTIASVSQEWGDPKVTEVTVSLYGAQYQEVEEECVSEDHTHNVVWKEF